MLLAAATTRHPALYFIRCPAWLRSFHSGEFLGKPLAGAVKADGDGVGADAQDDASLGMVEPIPSQETEKFLINRSEPGQSLEGWCLGRVDRGDILRLRAEPGTQAEPPFSAAMLIGEDPTRDRQEPGQCCFGVWCSIEPAPCDRKGLGHGVLCIGLDPDSPKGIRQHGAPVLLEGRLEPGDVAHTWQTSLDASLFPAFCAPPSRMSRCSRASEGTASSWEGS